MICKLCGSDRVSVFGRGENANRYCHACKGHEYRGKLIDRKTWDKWVNEEIEWEEV